MLDIASMATTVGPSHSTSSPSSTALFATDIPNNVVELRNVVLNEFHVLRKFLLISTCERALRVTLDSDLSSQIGFQLNNENIDNADENTCTEPNVATFLADDFSELFNRVNLVNEVILQPRQIQQVILTFRPWAPSKDPPDRAREFGGEDREQRSSNQKIYENGSVEPSSKNVHPNQFKVNGRLFLSATILDDDAQSSPGSLDEASMDLCQDIVVHFYSTVCRCILRADVPDIVFDDCVPGAVFVKDFSIWNLSEIPCAFQIHVKNGQPDQPALDLTDFDTELPVTSGQIKSCAHRRIRVMYKPRDVGDFSYSVHLENTFDVQNSTCIPIHCIVNAEYRKEGLLVTGVGEDGLLDFGDCYSNNGTFQRMTLRNITQESLVVNLGTDHSPGDQVNFYLQTEIDISSGSTDGLVPFIKPEENVTTTGEIENSSTGLSEKLGNSLGASINFDKKSRVEVLALERGEEKNLLVWFYPAGPVDEAKAARLQRRTFRLSLKCAEKKGRSKLRFSNIVQCKARICTSIVKLSTPELNFGDCNIGSTKSTTCEIINLSDLPALVTSCVTSTILSFRNKAERVVILPRQSYSLEIDLVPLKINPKYRKQITIDNFYNKDNQQVLEVRGKIMDRHHVLLHSRYYKLTTPSTNNFLNFDCVIVNNPSVRTLTIENVTEKCLTLGFNTSMPGELGIYQLRDDSQSDIGDDTDSLFSEGSEDDDHESRRRAYAASVNKEKLLETLEESQPRLSKAIVDSAPFPVEQDQKKTIPPRPPFTTAEKKTRMRMSLDLATPSFIGNGVDNSTGMASSLPGSGAGDGEAKELLTDVKPFTATNEEPRPLKRVQSSAMLSAIEAAANVLSENSQEEASSGGIEGVLKQLGNLVISQCSFPDEEAEKQYVDNQIKGRELLMHVLEDLARTLTPVRKVELLPSETKTLYVLLTVDSETRPSLQGRLQKLTAKVNIQLLEYDRELLDGGALEQPGEEDIRELPVHFKACRALLSLAQKNINFGKLLTNEHRAKTLVLNNVSELPLLYKLKKTGSIASGDLHIINGRTGILRPHSDREVNFVFQPSLGGSFHETLVVGNVYDPKNDQVVTLKASISRADTFWLNTSNIDFETVTVGDWSRPQSIVIVNNSKQSRTYVLKAADYVFDDRATKSMHDTNLPILKFMLEEKRKRPPLSAIAPEEEAIEALERKGIALERKGKADKAAKIFNQVSEMRTRLGSAFPKKSEALPTEGSEPDKNDRMSAVDMQRYHGTGISDPGAVGSRTVFMPKGPDGYVSLTLKGGDSKVVMVSILVPLLTASAACCQRIVGTIVAFERKNQDVVKKVYYEATTIQRALYDNSPGGVASDSFNLKLRTGSPESPFHPLITRSPSASPESSAPTSPYGSTPQSAAITNPFSSSSPELLSALSPFEKESLIAGEVSGVSSRNLGTKFSQTLESNGWGSQQHILDWSKEGEDLVSDDVDGVVDEDESSRSESGSGLFGFDPLFKVDLLHQSPDQALTIAEQRDGDDDAVMDLSSAAALARSLVSHRIQEPGKALFEGEVILDDSPDQNRREASFLLRSESPQDIWIQFHLAWEGDPYGVELWVSPFSEAVGRYTEGKSPAIDLSARRRSKQLRWELPERSEYSTTEKSTFVSSLFLKGNSVSVVTLIRPDQQVLEPPAAPTLNGGFEGNVQATGVLTMQARPDDGLSHQLLIRLKQVDRCIKVNPSNIVFPESELTAVLKQDLVIRNRAGTSITYTTHVTDTSLSSLTVSPRGTLTGSPTEVLVSPSSEVLDSVSDAVVNVYPASGHIEGHGSRSVKVTCRPLKPGKKSYTLHLRTSLCARNTEVCITTMAARVHYIHLPDLPDGVTLDMGVCFLNPPSKEKVVPLRLQNLACNSLRLTFKSNLAKQVYISTSDGKQRTDDVQLASGASSTVFMCLRPTVDTVAFEAGQCREIIGGMRITAQANAPGSAYQAGGQFSSPSVQKIVDEIMVKFHAIVGLSLMQVSASMIDLGRVKKVGGLVGGDFLVSNPSTQMPLHFSLSSKRAQLSVSEGHLRGRDSSRLNGGSVQSDMTVKFSLPVNDCGLIEDKIIVQNLSFPGQNAELVLRLFVDGGVVQASPEPPMPHFQQQQGALISSLQGPEFQLPPLGRKSGFINSRQPNGQRLPFLAGGFGGGGGDSSDRQVRKASSAGDFIYANSSPPPSKADESPQQGGRFGPAGTPDSTPFLSNSFLNLGPVFVSPDNRESTVDGATATETTDAPRPSTYSISDLRPYHSSLILTNFSLEPIELQPYSTLQMQIDPEQSVLASYPTCITGSYSLDAEMEAYCGPAHGDDRDVEELERAYTACEPVTELVCCGRPFVIQPHCTTRLLVSYTDLKHLSSAEVIRLSSRKLCAFEGLLVFSKWKPAIGQESSVVSADAYSRSEDSNGLPVGREAVEVVNIRGSICLSVGSLAKNYIELGKVGYANKWADVEFEITVKNISEADLVYKLADVPECFEILLSELRTEINVAEKVGRVAPKSSGTVRVRLCTSKLENLKQAGPCSWRICLQNCNNPTNSMELVVEAEMTVCTLRFGGLTEGALLLPPLTLPALPSSSPCSMQFVVENLSDEPLGVALQLEQAEETESLIMLEVVSQASSTVAELTLKPGGKVELRVCAHPNTDIIPPHFLAQHVPSRRTSRVGSADALSSKDVVHVIPEVAKEKMSDIPTSSEVLRVHDLEQTLSNLKTGEPRRTLIQSSELSSTVCLGQLYFFSSPHLPDCIPIHGTLLQGSSFDVSPHNLHLQASMAQEGPSGVTWVERLDTAGSSQIVVVRNFRAFDSLQFSVAPGYNEELLTLQPLSDFISVHPSDGLIPSRGSAEIVVKSLPWSKELHQNFSTDPEPLTFTLFVQDSEGQDSEKGLQRILVNIQPPAYIQQPAVEGSLTLPKTQYKDLSLDRKVGKDASSLAKAYKRKPPVLGLRGCTPVEGNLLCYEFNLGQQNISSGGRLHWDLTLVGDQDRPIHYRLGTISEGYASWLTISCSSGVVEAAQQKTVQLSFSTKAMGVYSTYLVVENLENPADFKTIHLSLEVVAPRNARPEAPSLTYFHVQVYGGRAEGTVIDMGEVFYNFWYRNRSFVVVNEAPVAMEFLLSSSMDKNDVTELNFSLANTSLKRFSSVTLGAKSSVRIWIHFCPGPAKDRPITEATDIMSANIYINCRLVKDYRQCIPFRAKCRFPQIGISTTDIVFSTRREGQTFNSKKAQEGSNGVSGDNYLEFGTVNAPLIENAAVVGSTGVPAELASYDDDSNGDLNGEALRIALPTTPRRDDDMVLCPAQQVVVIRNLFAHRKLQYIVKNDSLFFASDVPDPQIIPSTSQSVGENGSSQSFHRIIVRPNMESLLAHQKTILKQKYVEEHLTVYNRSNPREKYTVSLRITAGHLRNFFAAPGRKNSYPFNRLELLITGFLSAFYSLTSHILSSIAPVKFQTGQLQDMRHGSKEGDLRAGKSANQEVLSKKNEALFQALEKWLESCISGHSSKDYDSLFFDFHYLTDELVFYCLKERWSRGGGTLELATVQLAKLLYCALYRSQIFQMCSDCCQYFSSNDPLSSSLVPEYEVEGATRLYSDSLEGPAGESRLQTTGTFGSESVDKQLDTMSTPRQCLRFLEDWTGQLRHFLSYFPDSRDDLIPLRELSQKNQDSILACREALDRKRHFLLYR